MYMFRTVERGCICRTSVEELQGWQVSLRWEHSAATSVCAEIVEINVVHVRATAMALQVVEAPRLPKFRRISELCSLRKVTMCLWLASLPPLVFHTNQTAFVPGTHADTGLFLLSRAELTKGIGEVLGGGAAGRAKGIRPRQSSFGINSHEAAGVDVFSMAFIARIWRPLFCRAGFLMELECVVVLRPTFKERRRQLERENGGGGGP